jgi:adenylate kinase
MADEFDPERARRHERANEQQREISLERVAEKAAAKAVESTFRLLGIDMSDQDAVNNLRDDLRWTRRERSASEQPGVGKTTMIAALTAAAAAAASWVVGLATGFVHFGGPKP